MGDIARVLARLEPVSRLQAATPAAPLGYYKASCPAHDDRHASLSASPMRDGSIRLHCFTGCTHRQVLDAGGIDWRDLTGDGGPVVSVPVPIRRVVPKPTPKPAGPKRVRTLATTWYDVRDATGIVRACHKRVDYLLADGSAEKAPSWWPPDRQKPGLAGVPVAALPLYGTERLPALPAGAPVVITEGEKAAQALLDAGIPALGTVTGAASCPGPDALAALVGYDVVLWPDHDDAGREHMGRVAAALAALGIGCRWFAWRQAHPKDDAADYLARPAAEASVLRALLDNAPAWPPIKTDNIRLETLDNIQGKGCAVCARDRRNLTALAAKIGAIARAVRCRNLKPAERIALIDTALGLEQYQRNAGGTGPVYQPDALVAARTGLNRDTVAEFRQKCEASGAITSVKAAPPADLVARNPQMKKYDAIHLGPAAPADERERAQPLAVRYMSAVVARTHPKAPPVNAGRPRTVKVRDLLPETIAACDAGCPPTAPLAVTVVCTGCGQVVHEGRHLCAPAQTMPEKPALESTDTGSPETAPDPALAAPQTMPEKPAWLQSAGAVARRRQALRALAPHVGTPRPRRTCANAERNGCWQEPAEGDDSCPACRAVGWGEPEVAAAEVPVAQPACAHPGCEQPAAFDNHADGRHCRVHALVKAGGHAFPLRPTYPVAMSAD